jgi:hypothetical protein
MIRIDDTERRTLKRTSPDMTRMERRQAVFTGELVLVVDPVRGPSLVPAEQVARDEQEQRDWENRRENARKDRTQRQHRTTMRSDAFTVWYTSDPLFRGRQ